MAMIYGFLLSSSNRTTPTAINIINANIPNKITDSNIIRRLLF